MQASESKNTWAKVPISHIEDLRDAVLGAGLDATQMSRGDLSGGIAFSDVDGMVFTSGLIGGRVALSGPLSGEGVTIGVGLDLPAGTRHWLNEVETGNVGVYLPGDAHDSIYAPGALYATVTLTPERLEEEAAELDLVLDQRTLGGTGVHPRKVSAEISLALRKQFQRVHAGSALHADPARTMLDALLCHLARPPRRINVGTRPGGYGRIVERARAYISDNLSEPILVDEIARAAGTSRRTLFRAFAEILDETPKSYARRLRLHRIRSDVAEDPERNCTIALIANDWGMSDLGRMAGCYRELFGELPSTTLAKARRLH
ncbi:MAG: helix-turn-helix domain-containing protein [Sedimentitalea sp.]|uniref:helix-turn-helix domain-containing protein n=1 Tax=Sedimentitalea sp. TaxID=2048915 RepID=UPI003264F11A